MWMSSRKGARTSGLISVGPPILVQVELLRVPEWAARRHGLTHQAILDRLGIRVMVRCVGHVLEIVQMHTVNLHVLDIDVSKHWLDVF
jgi:hypothetical protein